MSPQAAQRLRRQAAFLLVLAIVVAAVVYLAAQPGHWRRGSAVIAVALLLAGILRVVLPPRYVGALAVRSKPYDALFCLVFGVGILVLLIRLA